MVVIALAFNLSWDATSAELYQLSWVIQQLLADPRRIVQVRAQLHTGQQVQYLHWADGKLRSARIAGIYGDHVALLDAVPGKVLKVHYAAILAEPGDAGPPTAVRLQQTSTTSAGRSHHQKSPRVATSAWATASPLSTSNSSTA